MLTGHRTPGWPQPDFPKSGEGRALDRRGTEIKPNGTDAAVRAVRKDMVMFAFKAAYQAKHGDTNANAIEQAWWRALRQAKATTVMEGVVGGVHHLWRPAPPA
jgi:hypothetical protein